MCVGCGKDCVGRMSVMDVQGFVSYGKRERRENILQKRMLFSESRGKREMAVRKQGGAPKKNFRGGCFIKGLLTHAITLDFLSLEILSESGSE